MAARTWNEWFWLPDNYTWKQVEEEIGSDYPDFKEYFKWIILIGPLLLIFRNYVLIPFVLEPIGRRAGIRRKPYPHPPPNEELEGLYKINRARPPRKMLVDAASRIDWTERKVERWLRLKALSMQMTTMEKFCDQGWQAFFYSCFFIWGLFFVVPQTFFWDPLKTIENLPFQRPSSAMWWYCTVDSGFYVAQTVLLFSLDRRHDFYVMLCHHVVTFFLHYFCVSMNIMKLLTLTIFIHEIVDIPLAVGKMFSYANKHYVGDYLAIVFAIVWVLTRLIAYPVMAMRPPLIAHLKVSWPSMFCFEAFGISLLLVHIIWTFDLIKAIKKRMTDNKMSDSRSSPEELSEEEQQTNLKEGEYVREQVQDVISGNIVKLRKEVRSLM
ncbi:TRAM/LAG1/CLN8 domain [Trinorchestia longiramus]|nr:TRAM/LAG1/CLN8 domain [Trinorchestia longiramus]